MQTRTLKSNTNHKKSHKADAEKGLPMDRWAHPDSVDLGSDKLLMVWFIGDGKHRESEVVELRIVSMGDEDILNWKKRGGLTFPAEAVPELITALKYIPTVRRAMRQQRRFSQSTSRQSETSAVEE